MDQNEKTNATSLLNHCDAWSKIDSAAFQENRMKVPVLCWGWRTRELEPRGMTRSMTSSFDSSSETPSRLVTRLMRSRPTCRRGDTRDDAQNHGT